MNKTELRIRDSFSVIGILFMLDYLQDEFGLPNDVRWRAEFRIPLSVFAYNEIQKRFDDVCLVAADKAVFFSVR